MEMFGFPGAGAFGVSNDTNAVRGNVKTATLNGIWRLRAMGGQLNGPIMSILLVMREPYTN